MVLVAGCQESLLVGASNNCGRQIEVSATDTSEGDLSWHRLGDGEQAEIRGLIEDPDFIYIYTREPEALEWERFVVPRDEWGQWRVEENYDVVVPLEGEFCP